MKVTEASLSRGREGTRVFQVPGMCLFPQMVTGDGENSAAAQRERVWSWPGGEQRKKHCVYLNTGLFNHTVFPDALRFAHCF